MEDHREMPRGRFRFRLAVALILLVAPIARAEWTYADGGTGRVQRLYRGVIARAAAAWNPASMVTSNLFYALATNEYAIVQQTNWTATVTNAWRGPGIVTAAFVQELDDILLGITPLFVDPYFSSPATNYNDWFAREAAIPFTGWLVTNRNRAECAIDDDWRECYTSFTENHPPPNTYSGYVGYFKTSASDGGAPPNENTTDSTGADWRIILTPTNYPMLTPAAVGHRANIGNVRAMTTNIWGEITGGEFRWTKDWREIRGTNTAAWMLWEIAAARAPYTWAGYPSGNPGNFGDGLLIPYWIDPYRAAWLKANTTPTNAYPELAATMKAELSAGPYYISYPERDIRDLAGNAVGEVFGVFGKRSISNRLYWAQIVSWHNRALVGGVGGGYAANLVLLTPRNPTNAPPSPDEQFDYVTMTNLYAPALTLTKAGSESNAFWATFETDYSVFINNDEGALNAIRPATNRWYWRQWKGNGIPRRYITTNEYPRYRTITAGAASAQLPPLAGLRYPTPAVYHPSLGQLTVEASEQAALTGPSTLHWQSVLDSPAWRAPPTNAAIVRLEYAPAQALYTEGEDEPLTRLTDLVLTEREAYLDYLRHCVAPSWTWTNAAAWSNSTAATFPDAATNEGYNSGSTPQQRWAASQANAAAALEWAQDRLDILSDQITGLPGQTIADMTNAANFSDIVPPFAPESTMDIDHNFNIVAGVQSTFWAAEYDPTSSSSSTSDDPWVGLGEREIFKSAARLPWPEYGSNAWLTVTNFWQPTFDWRWWTYAQYWGPSSHDFGLMRSRAAITNARPDMTDLGADLLAVAHYGRDSYRVDDLPWVIPAIARTDADPVANTFPACFVPAAKSLALTLPDLVSPIRELYAFGTRYILAEYPEPPPAITNYVTDAQLTEGWEPIFSALSYVLYHNLSNAAWSVTLTVATNQTYATPGSQAPWIASGVDIIEETPVLLFAVTNDYAALAAQGVIAGLDLDDADWTAVTNSILITPLEGAEYTYQSCTNLPQGSLTQPGQDGTVNCDHNALATFALLSKIEQGIVTNSTWFQRQIIGTETNWSVYSQDVIDYGAAETPESPATTNLSFGVWDWPGDWVAWDKDATGKRLDQETMWMQSAALTSTTFRVKIEATWRSLLPLQIWSFEK
jgi:hypothetical protein